MTTARYEVDPRDGATFPVIARPVFDAIVGRTIKPWEIEPGELVRTVNHDAPLYIWALEYSTASGVAHLSIGAIP